MSNPKDEGRTVRVVSGAQSQTQACRMRCLPPTPPAVWSPHAVQAPMVHGPFSAQTEGRKAQAQLAL